MEKDFEYWQRRADEEFAVADDCADANVAAIHRRLAIYYATLALDGQALDEPSAMRVNS